MRKQITKIGLISPIIALVAFISALAFALPPQASVHAQAANSNSSAGGSGRASAAQANAQTRLTDAKLKACQNREAAINNIMTRINTRAQKQLNLFDTIAARVENFYTTKGNTADNYDQLVAAVNSAKSQAQTDLSTLQGSSTFSCDGNNPRGAVTAFQDYLKTEITDLQNYRSTVKSLIFTVAQANGVTVSDSNQSTTQGGQQ
ncbi:MAG TPA: hypothetical protein VFT49_00240 [Candidatus Saccharimonadales bacterium]|nr:hypothetical protein [Candidatus Saccharimonadales bacterium]